MESAQQIIDAIGAKTGWNDASKLLLCLQYIDNLEDTDDFRDFLQQQADDEEGFSAEGPFDGADEDEAVVAAWVATMPGTQDVMAYIVPEDCDTAEDALHDFNGEIAGEYDLYFRTPDGVLHPTTPESVVSDFLDEDDEGEDGAHRDDDPMVVDDFEGEDGESGGGNRY